MAKKPRYMLNTRTGHVVFWNQHLAAENRPWMVECHADGTILGQEPKPEPKPEPPVADRSALIVEKIGELEEGNPEHFTKGGLPRVEVLEEMLEFDITMEERSAAWDEYLAR